MKRWLGLLLMLASGCRYYWVENAHCDGDKWLCNDPARPVCDLVNMACVPATVDGGADQGMACTAASAPVDCPVTMPICGDSACRACSGVSDDAACAARATTPYCAVSGAKAGQCVACRGAAGCAGTTPICGDDSVCRACAAHSDCSSGICVHDGPQAGACVAEADVAYVDNSAACAGTGTKSKPFCDLPAAVASGKSAILVAGTATYYSPITISSGSITIVGPGLGAAHKAQIGSATSSAVLINPTTPSNVVLDGLDLQGGHMPGFAAVNCSQAVGAVTLAIRNSALHESGLEGIKIDSCTVTIQANQITGNKSGGIALNGTTNYTVTNNIIAGNGLTGRGVTIADNATGTFAFNTVVGNLLTADTVGGIECVGVAKLIQNSIFVGNKMSGGTQFGSKCALSNVVTDAAETVVQGALKAAQPVFAGPADYHLSATGDNSCCVDSLLTMPGTPNQNLDVDGSPRPKGTGWDIGAHELR